MNQMQFDDFEQIEDRTSDKDELIWALRYQALIDSGIPTVEDRDVSYLLKLYTRIVSDDDIQF